MQVYPNGLYLARYFFFIYVNDGFDECYQCADFLQITIPCNIRQITLLKWNDYQAALNNLDKWSKQLLVQFNPT